MRKSGNKKSRRGTALLIVLMIVLSGCSQSDNTTSNTSSTPVGGQGSDTTPSPAEGQGSDTDVTPDADIDEPVDTEEDEPIETVVSDAELSIRFGRGDDAGDAFMLHLYDNPTAAEIARLVGMSDWDLPIYNYDDYDNWEVMQYYDIPSRYDIPAEPETVTSQKAGEVYYSDPNRILLFYHDAEVTGEFVKLGYIDYSDEFVTAVETNPVLEGWGNKIISISPSN